MKPRLAHERKDGLHIRRKLLKNVENELCENNVNDASSGSTDALDFDPVAFVRCHSVKGDSADVTTQVWQCAFEPDIHDANKTTRYVATCGGPSVCIIDSTNGKVFRKYNSPELLREKLYTLSWSTIMDHVSLSGFNVLAAGGAMGTIHLIHPQSDTMFLQHRVRSTTDRKTFISSLKFSRSQPSILFCATNKGSVLMYDIGVPRPPGYVLALTLLTTLSAEAEVFSLALSGDTILAAAHDGLYGWTLPVRVTQDSDIPRLKFTFPGSVQHKTVDSVVAIDDGLVATKCALHGLIYVWDLEATLDGSTSGEFCVEPTRTFKWSDTDNYFMNMGYSAGVLACGDDKGRVWVYNTTSPSSSPAVMLSWPDLEDVYVASKRKLRLGTYDIVVDQVALNHDASCLVAVTDNNMVCVWQASRTSCLLN